MLGWMDIAKIELFGEIGNYAQPANDPSSVSYLIVSFSPVCKMNRESSILITPVTNSNCGSII